jgi:hypothetical protein
MQKEMKSGDQMLGDVGARAGAGGHPVLTAARRPELKSNEASSTNFFVNALADIG